MIQHSQYSFYCSLQQLTESEIQIRRTQSQNSFDLVQIFGLQILDDQLQVKSNKKYVKNTNKLQQKVIKIKQPLIRLSDISADKKNIIKRLRMVLQCKLEQIKQTQQQLIDSWSDFLQFIQLINVLTQKINFNKQLYQKMRYFLTLNNLRSIQKNYYDKSEVNFSQKLQQNQNLICSLINFTEGKYFKIEDNDYQGTEQKHNSMKKLTKSVHNIFGYNNIRLNQKNIKSSLNQRLKNIFISSINDQKVTKLKKFIQQKQFKQIQSITLQYVYLKNRLKENLHKLSNTKIKQKQKQKNPKQSSRLIPRIINCKYFYNQFLLNDMRKYQCQQKILPDFNRKQIMAIMNDNGDLQSQQQKQLKNQKIQKSIIYGIVSPRNRTLKDQINQINSPKSPKIIQNNKNKFIQPPDSAPNFKKNLQQNHEQSFQISKQSQQNNQIHIKQQLYDQTPNYNKFFIENDMNEKLYNKKIKPNSNKFNKKSFLQNGPSVTQSMRVPNQQIYYQFQIKQDYQQKIRLQAKSLHIPQQAISMRDYFKLGLNRKIQKHIEAHIKKDKQSTRRFRQQQDYNIKEKQQNSLNSQFSLKKLCQSKKNKQNKVKKIKNSLYQISGLQKQKQQIEYFNQKQDEYEDLKFVFSSRFNKNIIRQEQNEQQQDYFNHNFKKTKKSYKNNHEQNNMTPLIDFIHKQSYNYNPLLGFDQPSFPPSLKTQQKNRKSEQISYKEVSSQQISKNIIKKKPIFQFQKNINQSQAINKKPLIKNTVSEDQIDQKDQKDFVIIKKSQISENNINDIIKIKQKKQEITIIKQSNDAIKQPDLIESKIINRQKQKQSIQGYVKKDIQNLPITILQKKQSNNMTVVTQPKQQKNIFGQPSTSTNIFNKNANNQQKKTSKTSDQNNIFTRDLQQKKPDSNLFNQDKTHNQTEIFNKPQVGFGQTSNRFTGVPADGNSNNQMGFTSFNPNEIKAVFQALPNTNFIGNKQPQGNPIQGFDSFGPSAFTNMLQNQNIMNNIPHNQNQNQNNFLQSSGPIIFAGNNNPLNMLNSNKFNPNANIFNQQLAQSNSQMNLKQLFQPRK